MCFVSYRILSLPHQFRLVAFDLSAISSTAWKIHNWQKQMWHSEVYFILRRVLLLSKKEKKKIKYLSCALGHLACYFMVYLFLRSLPQWFNAQFTRHYWNYFEKRLFEIPAMQICKRQSDRKVTLILAVKLKIADNNLRQLNCRDLLVNSNKIFYKLGLESISRQKASAYLA